jgi:hypothetical protein
VTNWTPPLRWAHRDNQSGYIYCMHRSLDEEDVEKTRTVDVITGPTTVGRRPHAHHMADHNCPQALSRHIKARASPTPPHGGCRLARSSAAPPRARGRAGIFPLPRVTEGVAPAAAVHACPRGPRVGPGQGRVVTRDRLVGGRFAWAAGFPIFCAILATQSSIQLQFGHLVFGSCLVFC